MTDEERSALARTGAGVPRLGVPPLRVADPQTALPPALVLAASFDPRLAREAGAVLGREARARGCNVVRAGTANLVRDPRNGHNPSCASEDPLLAAAIAAEQIVGAQSQGVIAVLGEFPLSSNETNRPWIDALIDTAAHRESDLLAFELAIERAQPGAVLAVDHRINGRHVVDSSYLIEHVLASTWGFRGYVMGDGRPADSVRRILRTILRFGLDAWGPPPAIDDARHRRVALEIARRGIVLLENRGLLPLSVETTAHIAVIGGDAHLEALARLLPDAHLEAAAPVEAALVAGHCDAAIVFASRAEDEHRDRSDLSLPPEQDARIAQVAAANPLTIVVLDTAGPVAMPWREHVQAILQAWSPGPVGAQALAEVLAGTVTPSGRLPVTFPASLAQLPRPALPGAGMPPGTPTTIRYDEGADVGYRWFASRNHVPLYPFGHGLSYTRFEYADLQVRGGETITATFTVSNRGPHDAADVPQLYLVQPRRLLGFERVQLAAGESRRIALAVDPRMLARFDGTSDRWVLPPGTYTVALGRSATELVLSGDAFVMQPQVRRAM